MHETCPPAAARAPAVHWLRRCRALQGRPRPEQCLRRVQADERAGRSDYDPAHPETAKAQVAVDTASMDLGDPEYNREVSKKEWFNSTQFPKATFVSSSIKPAGAGKLTVAGKLTIKGKSTDVSFPVSARTEAGKQVFEGQLPIHRLAFNIGEGEWKDTSMVADEVVLKFRVTAAK
jgi:polyisoprenoid-binding protein YceI